MLGTGDRRAGHATAGEALFVNEAGHPGVPCARALPAETKVESAKSQSKSGTSFNVSNSRFVGDWGNLVCSVLGTGDRRAGHAISSEALFLPEFRPELLVARQLGVSWGLD